MTRRNTKNFSDLFVAGEPRCHLCGSTLVFEEEHTCSQCDYAFGYFERFSETHDREMISALVELDVTRRRLANLILSSHSLFCLDIELLREIKTKIDSVLNLMTLTETNDEVNKLIIHNSKEIRGLLKNKSFYLLTSDLSEIKLNGNKL
ncbi:hypothetical protein [Vibrio ostreicida]|uniref:hypothetical protein n=1 Tax=Vibrio ostreicida TaxID=526588 RepID=UPI000971250F|nr:hypothetical protein [Vibrio ostreicida]